MSALKIEFSFLIQDAWDSILKILFLDLNEREKYVNSKKNSVFNS